MENLLVYGPQAKEESTIPLPIGETHKFAPIALGVSLVSPYSSFRRNNEFMQDVALVAAHVLSGTGEHGFDDKHRGQLIVLTGIFPRDIKVSNVQAKRMVRPNVSCRKRVGGSCTSSFGSRDGFREHFSVCKT